MSSVEAPASRTYQPGEVGHPFPGLTIPVTIVGVPSGNSWDPRIGYYSVSPSPNPAAAAVDNEQKRAAVITEVVGEIDGIAAKQKGLDDNELRDIVRRVEGMPNDIKLLKTSLRATMIVNKLYEKAIAHAIAVTDSEE